MPHDWDSNGHAPRMDETDVAPPNGAIRPDQPAPPAPAPPAERSMPRFPITASVRSVSADDPVFGPPDAVTATTATLADFDDAHHFTSAAPFHGNGEKHEPCATCLQAPSPTDWRSSPPSAPPSPATISGTVANPFLGVAPPPLMGGRLFAQSAYRIPRQAIEPELSPLHPPLGSPPFVGPPRPPAMVEREARIKELRDLVRERIVEIANEVLVEKAEFYRSDMKAILQELIDMWNSGKIFFGSLWYVEENDIGENIESNSAINAMFFNDYIIINVGLARVEKFLDRTLFGDEEDKLADWIFWKMLHEASHSYLSRIQWDQFISLWELRHIIWPFEWWNLANSPFDLLEEVEQRILIYDFLTHFIEKSDKVRSSIADLGETAPMRWYRRVVESNFPFDPRYFHTQYLRNAVKLFHEMFPDTLYFRRSGTSYAYYEGIEGENFGEPKGLNANLGNKGITFNNGKWR